MDAKLEGYEGQRIDALYNIPTFEYAQSRLLERLEGYLRERLYHEKNYRLPPLPSPSDDLLLDNLNAVLGSQHDSMMDEDEDFEDSSMVGDY